MIVPFTRVLLDHPEVLAGSTARVATREAVTDAAAAAAGDVNLDALNLAGLRRLSSEAAEKRERASRRAHGMEIVDDGVEMADLGDYNGSILARMDKVHAKGGSMLNESKGAGDLDGLEFTASAVRAVSERTAKAAEAKAVAAEATRKLKAEVAETAAGRAAAASARGGKGKGRGGRLSWKKAAADLSQSHASVEEALHAQVRELKAQLAAAQLAAGLPAA